MFIIWGFGKQTTKDYGNIEMKKCSTCNNDVEMRKIKVTTWFTIFFIPIIPYRTKYYILCPICKNGIEVSKDFFASEINSKNENNSEKYSGKNETQINYLKEIENRDQKND